MLMSRAKILIVDDAPFIREMLLHILRRTTYEVVGEAENGEDAVRMAVEKKPDIVLMDIVMPQKSGLEATKEILEFLPTSKVIMMSTVDQEIMTMKALEAGACEYVHKPFHAKDLVKVIEKVATGKGADA